MILRTRSFWLKVLSVKTQTSYQSHTHRTEYHLGVQKVLPNEKHRMNRGFFIEIATGDPDESDIMRFEDIYGR